MSPRWETGVKTILETVYCDHDFLMGVIVYDDVSAALSPWSHFVHPQVSQAPCESGLSRETSTGRLPSC